MFYFVGWQNTDLESGSQQAINYPFSEPQLQKLFFSLAFAHVKQDVNQLLALTVAILANMQNFKNLCIFTYNILSITNIYIM